jgi:hypothetical protein
VVAAFLFAIVVVIQCFPTNFFCNSQDCCKQGRNGNIVKHKKCRNLKIAVADVIKGLPLAVQTAVESVKDASSTAFLAKMSGSIP